MSEKNMLNDLRKKAESEARIVIDELEAELEDIRKRHEHEKGMDRGAKEIKIAIQNGMKRIAEIREKYGIPHPEK